MQLEQYLPPPPLLLEATAVALDFFPPSRFAMKSAIFRETPIEMIDAPKQGKTIDTWRR
jgi:hypothetical protein